MKKQLQRQCKPSRVGWLYDEVTNPFILCITKDFTNTFYCASQKPYFITYRKSFGRLSKTISWSTFKKNLIPFNLSNLHWMLIYINMKKSVIQPPIKAINDIIQHNSWCECYCAKQITQGKWIQLCMDFRSVKFLEGTWFGKKR